MSDSAQNRDALPQWAKKMISLYESRAVNQFILHGNVNDRLYLPLRDKASLGGIRDFLLRVLLPQFDVILSYDLGNGIRVEKGGEIFSQWIGANESPELPRQPRPAIEFLTRYFRYLANLARLTEKVRSGEALRRNLIDYKPPVARDVMEAQIRLAVNEASDWDFVPPAFRGYRKN